MGRVVNVKLEVLTSAGVSTSGIPVTSTGATDW